MSAMLPYSQLTKADPHWATREGRSELARIEAGVRRGSFISIERLVVIALKAGVRLRSPYLRAIQVKVEQLSKDVQGWSRTVVSYEGGRQEMILADIRRIFENRPWRRSSITSL
jgi:hypothetical protein